MNKKVLSLAALKKKTQEWRRAGRKIVFTNGTFDILHRGHVTYLQKARQCGDVLVVGVNSDRSVKAYKGPGRPLNPQEDRTAVLSALECVTVAVVFNDPTPIRLITAIKPDVLVKGADWKKSQIAGAKEVESWGGKVVLIRLVPGRSTTRILKLLKFI